MEAAAVGRTVEQWVGFKGGRARDGRKGDSEGGQWCERESTYERSTTRGRRRARGRQRKNGRRETKRERDHDGERQTMTKRDIARRRRNEIIMKI